MKLNIKIEKSLTYIIFALLLIFFFNIGLITSLYNYTIPSRITASNSSKTTNTILYNILTFYFGDLWPITLLVPFISLLILLSILYFKFATPKFETENLPHTKGINTLISWILFFILFNTLLYGYLQGKAGTGMRDNNPYYQASDAFQSGISYPFRILYAIIILLLFFIIFWIVLSSITSAKNRFNSQTKTKTTSVSNTESSSEITSESPPEITSESSPEITSNSSPEIKSDSIPETSEDSSSYFGGYINSNNAIWFYIAIGFGFITFVNLLYAIASTTSNTENITTNTFETAPTGNITYSSGGSAYEYCYGS